MHLAQGAECHPYAGSPGCQWLLSAMLRSSRSATNTPPPPPHKVKLCIRRKFELAHKHRHQLLPSPQLLVAAPRAWTRTQIDPSRSQSASTAPLKEQKATRCGVCCATESRSVP